ncbi:MAG: TraR/DksA C4-type zinc finger protein [Nitrospirota bacterium]
MEKKRNVAKSKRTTAKRRTTKTTKMNVRQKKIAEIKKKLLGQKKSLLSEALAALNELPGQTVFPDLGDQASAEIDRSFMLRLRGREHRLLKKIEDAIERIEMGIFGICDKCGQEIDIRRLEARPVTTMCIECKILQEEEEKLMEH